MNYFQVNVNYDRQTGEDNPGRVKEAYLVNAATCGDAEKAVLDEIKPFIFGDCETPKIQKKSYFELFKGSPNSNLYYEAKVEFIIVDGEKELRKTVNILVLANSIEGALSTLLAKLVSYDYEIIRIKKTGITDILLTQNN